MVGGIRCPQCEHDFWNGEAGPEQDILGVWILHEWEPVQDSLTVQSDQDRDRIYSQ